MAELLLNDTRIDVNATDNGTHCMSNIQEGEDEQRLFDLFLAHPELNPNIGELVFFLFFFFFSPHIPNC